MSVTEWCLPAVGDVSARLQLALDLDDLDEIAGLVAACEIVRERAAAKLAGRVTTEAIEAAKVEAKVALGW